MSRYFCEVPLKIRLVMLRVVSAPHERLLHRPVRDHRIFGANQLHGLQPTRRRQVVMHIDALRDALRG